MKSFDTQVVGMQYRVTPSTRRYIAQHAREDGSVEVLLIREPENNQDKNAIKVSIRHAPYRGLHIGYVPRTVASVYAGALDENAILVKSSTIDNVNVDDGTAELHIVFSKRSKRKTPVTKRPKKKSSKRA